jgi:hypothetical protein
MNMPRDIIARLPSTTSLAITTLPPITLTLLTAIFTTPRITPPKPPSTTPKRTASTAKRPQAEPQARVPPDLPRQHRSVYPASAPHGRGTLRRAPARVPGIPLVQPSCAPMGCRENCSPWPPSTSRHSERSQPAADRRACRRQARAVRKLSLIGRSKKDSSLQLRPEGSCRGHAITAAVLFSVAISQHLTLALY